MSADRSTIITRVCEFIETDNLSMAAALINRDYPFEPVATVERKYGVSQATRVFVRDGFIDRYAGTRLIFPGVLRICSLAMPDAFPFHPNWRMRDTHEAFWELSPTIDHVIPIARGGADNESNWVTTSMRRNSAKSNWTLEQLGWQLHPSGDIGDWDGLLGWFRTHVASHPLLLQNPSIRQWNNAVRAVVAG